MEVADLKDKKIAILGLGVNNRALTFWLLKQGLKVIICDANKSIIEESQKNLSSVQKKLLKKITEWRVGESYLKNLSDFDLIFRAPGLPFLTPELQQAKKAGVILSNQTELFLKLAPCQVIGVTGTKGKSTTAAMIKHLLEYGESRKKKVKSRKFYLAGNIGQDPFEFIDQLQEEDAVVLELSSFQLQGIEVSPPIAVVTRISQDHLDHHRSIKEYVASKANIIRFQTKKDFAVISADQKANLEISKKAKSQVIFYSKRKKLKTGIFLKKESDKLFSIVAKKGDRAEEIVGQEAEASVKGKHNLENWAAACAVGSFIWQMKAEDCRQAFSTYSSLPHRLEFLKEVNQVSFYNDSYSTNPDSTIAALNAFRSPIILICGGSSKNANFNQLAKTILKNQIRAVLTIGQEGPKIQRTIKKFQTANSPILKQLPDLTFAFNQAIKLANPGEIILLSPACASFDQFANAFARGNKFKELVNQVK